jgi:hypothetical protein
MGARWRIERLGRLRVVGTERVITRFRVALEKALRSCYNRSQELIRR